MIVNVSLLLGSIITVVAASHFGSSIALLSVGIIAVIQGLIYEAKK